MLQPLNVNDVKVINTPVGEINQLDFTKRERLNPLPWFEDFVTNRPNQRPVQSEFYRI